MQHIEALIPGLPGLYRNLGDHFLNDVASRRFQINIRRITIPNYTSRTSRPMRKHTLQ